jgi:hypothetical protein
MSTATRTKVAMTTIERSDLVAAIDRVAGAATTEKRRTRKKRKLITLSAAGKTLTVAAGEDVAVQTAAKAATPKAWGPVRVALSDLRALLRWQDGHVELTPYEGWLSVATSEITAAIPADKGDVWGARTADFTLPLSRRDLDTVQRVACCASSDESRPILAAVAFQGDKVIGTDSYRLAVGNMEATCENEWLLPAKAVRWLPQRLLPGESISLSVDADRVWWSTGDVDVSVERTPGDFPNWRSIAKAPDGGSITCLAADLTRVLRTFIPFAVDVRPVVLAPNGRKVEVALSEVADAPSLKATLEATTKGFKDRVAFNADYLRELVDLAQRDEITLLIGDSPLKPVALEGENVFLLLMPVRIA